MGSQLAMRLINAGYRISIYNRSKEKTKKFEKIGARIARSPMALAEDCDFLLICVTDFEAVKKYALQLMKLLLPTIKILWSLIPAQFHPNNQNITLKPSGEMKSKCSECL